MSLNLKELKPRWLRRNEIKELVTGHLQLFDQLSPCFRSTYLLDARVPSRNVILLQVNRQTV
jgi:hypothetical protein